MLLIPDDIILEREDQVAKSSVQRIVIEVLLWWEGQGSEGEEVLASGNQRANMVSSSRCRGQQQTLHQIDLLLSRAA